MHTYVKMGCTTQRRVVNTYTAKVQGQDATRLTEPAANTNVSLQTYDPLRLKMKRKYHMAHISEVFNHNVNWCYFK